MTPAGGLISLLVGTVLLRLVLTGTYGRYVRPGMGPWLAVAGVAVLVVGLVTLLRYHGIGVDAEQIRHRFSTGTTIRASARSRSTTRIHWGRRESWSWDIAARSVGRGARAV